MEEPAHQSLSQFARLVVSAFEKREEEEPGKRITVNPIVSKFASVYEKVRNAMEYREDEVILRSTIERILKRRLLLGGNAKTASEPLIRELLWARYLPENSIPQTMIADVEQTIDLYLELRLKVMAQHKFPDSLINEWTYQLMSSEIEHILNPHHEKEVISNFMFQVLRDDVMITDDNEQTRDVQVFIAIHRAFSRDDIAFLRYHLFNQYFGKLTRENMQYVVDHFPEGNAEIARQINYPAKEKVYTYVKRRTAVFLILEDVLEAHRDNPFALVENEQSLKEAVVSATERRYSSISSKVRRAVVRSVAFILLTKVIFAFAVEGTYERLFYGHIFWTSMVINTTLPPVLMIVVSLFIRTPGNDNTERIVRYVKKLLYEESPRLGSGLNVQRVPKKGGTVDAVFNILWVFAFILSFGAIIFILTKLHFNPISELVFIFFLAIVSFLTYRIALTANLYVVGEKQGLFTPVIDFLFMPVVRVGRRLTHSISQVNFLLFVFDFFIETPFKLLFAFFEQWFYFLHTKSEELG